MMSGLSRLLLGLLLAGCWGQAAAAGEAAAATLPGSTNPVGPEEVLHVFLALLLILGLIVMVAWLMRRYVTLPAGRSGALRMLAAISVGQRERVVLVQAGETQLLIGIAPGQVRTLHVFDKPVLLADGHPPAGGDRFAERLAAALTRSGKGKAE